MSFLQQTILGNDTPLFLFHSENGATLPTASTVKLFTSQLASPYWSQIGDIDVLTSGGLVDTGLYGIVLPTSGLTVGTYCIQWSWTSSVTTATYDVTAQFNIVADTSTILNYISNITGQISRAPYPNNALIAEIAKTLGIEDNVWNKNFLNSVMEANGMQKKTYASLEKIPSQIDKLYKKVDFEGKRRYEDNNKTVENLKKEIETVRNQIQNMSVASINFLNNKISTDVTSKDDLFDSFDIWSKQIVSLFNKVDFCLEEITKVQEQLTDMEITLPSLVANEQKGLIKASAEQLLTNALTGQKSPEQQGIS